MLSNHNPGFISGLAVYDMLSVPPAAPIAAITILLYIYNGNQATKKEIKNQAPPALTIPDSL